MRNVISLVRRGGVVSRHLVSRGFASLLEAIGLRVKSAIRGSSTVVWLWFAHPVHGAAAMRRTNEDSFIRPPRPYRGLLEGCGAPAVPAWLFVDEPRTEEGWEDEEVFEELLMLSQAARVTSARETAMTSGVFIYSSSRSATDTAGLIFSMAR